MVNVTSKQLGKRCKKNMTRLGIVNEISFKKRLQEIFETSYNQQSALIDIYKIVFPDWERIKKIEGFPVVGCEMWEYICGLFIKFDREKHPEFLNGGLWLNTGFSSSPELGGWEISFQGCNVIYN
jgi:hypothetical protein